MAAHNDHQPADYRHRDRIRIRRALLSVSDKTGLLELAQALDKAGVDIISTGGTYSAIKAVERELLVSTVKAIAAKTITL